MPSSIKITFQIFLLFLTTAISTAAETDNPLHLPTIGERHLTILSPALLELTYVTTKTPEATAPTEWNFVTGDFKPNLPLPSEFEVITDGKKIPIKSVGFKRRPIYAPLKNRDLRIGNSLYLRLADAIPDGQSVEVKNPNGKLWKNSVRYSAIAHPVRWSPVLHVTPEGYTPQLSKRAMVGYYLGTLGEMEIPATEFKLIEAGTTNAVFTGKLIPRKDVGYEPPDYQQVLEADFTDFQKPGEYQLLVPGLGASCPFFIDDGVPALFARTFALGLYHQRCGAANELPFTRFVHGRCHFAPAEIPDSSFSVVNEFLADMSGNFSTNPRHKAPQLKNISASLYPFANKGKIDVSAGHHDAGDYSKYTINSAQLVHTLVIAADIFPGAATLDNLGLPESGDGKGDLLQEAKWEADFLAKMQDADGGFYFLVYPRERAYEHDVLPDKGDPQVVFPKTTAATAAATAALAQTASSRAFKKQFPEAAATYAEKANKGWQFLERAMAKFGRDGSYQKITHYGDEFMHDDELAWAATEMLLLTGDERIQKELIAHFNPADKETRRWTWWRLFESYGCAVRSYAFAAKTGRVPKEKLDQAFLRQCEDEIIAAAQDQLDYSQQNAYGVSFPRESKRFRNAGWFFSSDAAFDLAVAAQMDFPIRNDPRPKFIEAIIANLNYEAGCNPINVSFISGLGWKRPREMVHHVAQNGRQTLPPSGLIWGNIQEGFAYLEPYKKELGALTFPPDWVQQGAYPFYDRWGDSFNTSQEFVVPNLARAVAASAFLMTQTGLTNQSWRCAPMQIVGLPDKISANQKLDLRLIAKGIDFTKSRTVWEMAGAEPALVADDKTFSFTVAKAGNYWIEAETHLPDGRRLFATANFVVR